MIKLFIRGILELSRRKLDISLVDVTMSLLQNHLEQISLSASAIADLSFPPPKPFVNALLGQHDITTLIRDTEAHERALFSVDNTTKSQRRATRRGTMFVAETERESMISRIYAVRDRTNQSAVARVLGGDMMDAIKRSTAPTSDRTTKSGLDIEVLLRGAEMLCNVYPVAGAKEKIASIRSRHREITASLEYLEKRVADQAEELERMNLSQYDDSDYHKTEDTAEAVEVTDEDIELELEAIRELEAKKRRLEARVTGMEKDLGGLLR
ncbi:hypothetical protein TRV_03958 [Trichophyton verrucosum HKI 0517]|uniref:DASH complex subunit SPC34 n=1 Tax=Trichophyton verrucosum (strain HKI 0517) TaxID=663202 RepID=D4DA14_TRIVH|nr:uncharacterized protein TRV_03958 [Trichophyton verrucosum HKI 0517]EFE41310.1 hypothetical protein TRV_03958 [Trichophyton verrucosum HKI 0517]